MYQCLNSSKCISVYRLLDNNNDCPYIDDENIIVINNTDAGKQLDKTHYNPLSPSGTYMSHLTKTKDFKNVSNIFAVFLNLKVIFMINYTNIQMNGPY